LVFAIIWRWTSCIINLFLALIFILCLHLVHGV
jgi:hypothetical protein